MDVTKARKLQTEALKNAENQIGSEVKRINSIISDTARNGENHVMITKPISKAICLAVVRHYKSKGFDVRQNWDFRW